MKFDNSNSCNEQLLQCVDCWVLKWEGTYKIAMLCLWTEQAKAASVPIAEHCPITKSLLALEKTVQGKDNEDFI